jgi:hypothetical protein
MPDDPSPLPYRSKGDAVVDDVHAMHRSLRTWIILCTVWGVGLIVWAGYLALIAYLVLRVLA